MTLPAYTFANLLADARIFMDDKVQEDGSSAYSDNLLIRVLMGLGSKIAALDISPSVDTAFNTVANQQQYSYPSDAYWWPKQGLILYAGTWLPLTFDILGNLIGADITGTLEQSTPNTFYIMDGKINLFPVPDNVYQIKIISEKRFPELDTTASGIATTLALSFFTYFDPSYKDICWRYIKLMVQMGRNDKNSMLSYNAFFDMQNAQSDWRFIVRTEEKKYQANAKNRRAGGDVQQTYGDYGLGGLIRS